MDIIIKKMETEAEVRGKAFVHWSAWHETYPGLVKQSYLDQLTPEMCEEIAFRWRDNILVAKDGDRVVGFVGYGEPDGSVGEVFALYVLPSCYRQGVGHRLMAAAKAQLIGCEQLRLWVLRENRRAIRFYQAEGFFPDGAEKWNPLIETAEIRMTLRSPVLRSDTP